MAPDDLRNLLSALASGTLDLEAALSRLQGDRVADLGYAHVDLDRRRRCGFPEVIFCEGKTPEWVEGVARKLLEAGQDCLATRLSPSQAVYLSQKFPQAEIDLVARTFWLPAQQGSEQRSVKGNVVVLTAGTSDLPVAKEAYVTAKALGTTVTLIADVGVAGIHRLLRHPDQFADADAIIVVSGVDGALPSVVGRFVDSPVIALPPSLRYDPPFVRLSPLSTLP